MSVETLTRIGAIKEALDRRAESLFFALYVSQLPPGSLTEQNAELVPRIEALGLSVPRSALARPMRSAGTTLLVDGDGPTARIHIRRSTMAGARTRWLDPRGLKAVDEAEAAAVRETDSWDGDQVASTELCEDEPVPLRTINGGSIGLAIGLAFLSEILGQPLREDVCASGMLDFEGRLGPVEQVRGKARALRLERPWVSTLVVPQGSNSEGVNDLQVTKVRTLAEAAAAFGLDLSRPARAPIALDALPIAVERTHLLAAERARSVSWLRARLEQLWERVRLVPPAERTQEIDRAAILALWRLVEYRTHAGASATDLFAGLEAILARRPGLLRLHASQIAGTKNAFASSLIDDGQLGEAKRVAAEALRVVGEDDVCCRMRIEGTLGRIAAHALQTEEAIARLSGVVESQIQELRRESNIPRCYLISCLLRSRGAEAARTQLAEGRATNQEIRREGWSTDNDKYLDLEEAKIALFEGAIARVEELWERYQSEPDFWPRFGFLRRLVNARISQGRLEDAMKGVLIAFNERGGEMVRWLAATIAAPVAAALERVGRSEEAAPLLENIRVACSAIRPVVDAPYAAFARRIAAGEQDPTLLESLALAEIY